MYGIGAFFVAMGCVSIDLDYVTLINHVNDESDRVVLRNRANMRRTSVEGARSDGVGVEGVVGVGGSGSELG